MFVFVSYIHVLYEHIRVDNVVDFVIASLIERRPTRLLLFFSLPASSAAATVGVVALAVVVADVALTREAGKNAKLAALLEDAGISSVEVMEGRTMQLFLVPVLHSRVGV